jgi:hypothetical protein
VNSTSNAAHSHGFTASTHPAFALMAGCGVLIVVLGLIATSGRARLSAHRTAEQLNPEALGGAIACAVDGRA